MRAYFVSDLHLIDGDHERTKTFVRFLETLRDAKKNQDIQFAPAHLFLVGDIFDLWISNHEYFQNRFRTVITVLRDLLHLGVEIHYFEGNHDLYLADFWQHDVGVIVHAGHAKFAIGGYQIRVEHGDLMNPNDKGYLFLRAFLRTSVMKVIACSLPDSIVSWIGERASQASRKYTSHAKSLSPDRIKQLIRSHAESVALIEPFDLIITGHVHVVDDYRFQQGARSSRSIGLGSWFDSAKTFVITETAAEWLKVTSDGKLVK